VQPRDRAEKTPRAAAPRLRSVSYKCVLCGAIAVLKATFCQKLVLASTALGSGISNYDALR